MPRQSSKSVAEKVGKKGSVADPSPGGKRSIRWFVHPPTFHFTNNRTTPTTKKSKSPSIVTTLAEDAGKYEPTLTPNSTTTASPTLPKHLFAFAKPAPMMSISSPRATEEISNPLVHQLQRELEEAKEQIQALEKVKEFQAQETERMKRELRIRTGQSLVSSASRNLNLKTPESNDLEIGNDYSSTSTCSSTSSVRDEAGTKYVAKGATCDLLEETDHPIAIDTSTIPLPSEDMILDGSIEDEDKDPDTSRRVMTPSSMTGPLLWQALAFENVGGIDDENSMNQMESVVPPMEVMTIRDPPSKEVVENIPSGNIAQMLAMRLRDAHERANAYRQKLEASQDLVASLFRDLERARRSIQALAARNISLSRQVKSLKLEKEDRMIHRSSLMKACVYISPVFILCGGLEFFVSTVVMVWILVELDASWYLDAEEDDDDDNLSNEENALLKLQETEFPIPIARDLPIPRNIVLSTDQGDLDTQD